MRYWFDTEFMEDGKTIDLLSIGIISEDGRSFYREVKGARVHKANEWVRKNVLPLLSICVSNPDHALTGICRCPAARWDVLNLEIESFCNPEKYGKPEFWAYYASYDWVALCQLYGAMVNLPKGWPMFCMDIKQWCMQLGNPKLPKDRTGTEHHALYDAEWNREAWNFLYQYQQDLMRANLARTEINVPTFLPLIRVKPPVSLPELELD